MSELRLSVMIDLCWVDTMDIARERQKSEEGEEEGGSSEFEVG